MSVNKSYSKENIDYIGGLPVDYAHAIYAYDTSTPENTAMASKYIFIAKVNKVLRTEYWNPVEVEVDENTTTTLYDPFTVYSIDVIKNIKGELITSESIELMQYGGINKEGDSYTTHEKEIEVYDLVTNRYPENATGTMKKELTTVNYYYTKKHSNDPEILLTYLSFHIL